MCKKDISEHACLDLLKTFPNFWPRDKILEGANSIQKLAQTTGVIGGCDEGQVYFRSVQRFVKQIVLKQVKDSDDLCIILFCQDDALNELNFVFVLSLLAYQTEDTACLEEIANRYQHHAGVGYLMITLGVMLHHRMKHKQSETCFLSALSCFQHEQDYMGSAVATVNLAAFYKLSGDYQKAQSSCDDAAVLCHDIVRITTRDVHLPWKVLRRVASLLKEFGNYKSYHGILSIGAKCDIGSNSDSSTVKHMKQLVTLQLKEQEGEQIEGDELKEFASQLFVLLDPSHADALRKTESLNADLITTVVAVAKMCCDANFLKEAWMLIEKLESTFLQVHGGNCSLYGLLLYQIGHFKVNYGDLNEAESTLQQAEEIIIHYFGRGYHMVASCKSLLGTCSMRKGDKKAAFSYLREAETIFKKVNHHHPEVAEILLKFAFLYSEDGNFDNAKLTIEESLEMFRLACGEVSPQTASAYLQGASILQKVKEFRLSAVDKVKKAIDIFVHLGLPHYHPDVALCHSLLGQLQLSLGQVKEAEEQFVLVHQQLSSQNDSCMKTKVIANEHMDIFFQVQADGAAGRCSHTCSSHFLSLVSLVDMKTGDEKRSHMCELLSCLERHDTEVLTVFDYTGKDVYCTSHRVLEADRYFYCILINGSVLNPFKTNQGIDFGEVHVLSPSNSHGKKPPFLLLWKTSAILETRDLSCVNSSFRESVKMLCLQPKFRKGYKEGQEFYMELTIPEDSCTVSPLFSQIDSLPLLVDLELSKSQHEYHDTDCVTSASLTSGMVWPLAHVSYFSFKFSTSHQALLVFYHWISSLGKTLDLSEVQDVSIPKASPVPVYSAVYFLFREPRCASLFLAVKGESVLVKCRAVKEFASTCICSLVKSALVGALESFPSVVRGSIFESSLQLPCEDVSGECIKKSSKRYCHCKDLQSESSYSDCSSEKLDSCAQADCIREPDSGGLSVDLLQNEDDEYFSFTAHPEDKVSTEVCVNLLESLLRNRQASLEVRLSGIDEVSPCSLHTADGAEQLTNSLLSPGSTSSLNSVPASPSSVHEKPEFVLKSSPYLVPVEAEQCHAEAGLEKDTRKDSFSDTSSVSHLSCGSIHFHEWSVGKSSCEGGLISEYYPDPETKGNALPDETLQETKDKHLHGVQSVHTCYTKEESGKEHVREFGEIPGPSFATVEVEDDEGTIYTGSLVSELQDEVACLHDQCRELREQITELKEKLKQSEQEKQDLQAEVGRQLFLESKEKRRSEKILQPSSEHSSEWSMPCRARGAPYDFSCMDGKLLGGADPSDKSGFLLQQRLQEISNSLSESELSRMKDLVRPKMSGFRLARIREGSKLFEELESRGELSCSYVKDLLERIHRFDLAEKLGVPSHDSAELLKRHSNSPQEGNQVKELPGRCHNADDKTSDEMQENIENARGTEVNEEVSGCKSSSGNSSNSEGDIAAFTYNPDFENSSESSSVAHIGNAGLSSESSGLASISSQSSPNSAVSVQLLTTDTNSSSVTSQDVCDVTVRFTLNSTHSAEEICESSSESAFPVASSGEKIQERSVSSLTTNEECESGEMSGACAAKDENIKETLNCHFGANDVPDGPVCSPDRAQDSLNLEHLAGVKQDALPDGDVTEKQNGPGSRIGGPKDTVRDQTDSNLSNQSNKWEHLGARPRDRPPNEDRSSEAVSLCSSFVDLVPQQVAGPMASGVADAFLARHSEDKNLHESLYYSNTEKVLAEDSSLQGASYVDGMINLNDSNKAKPYFGDCQVVSRPDPYSTSHFPVLTLTGGAYDRSNGDSGFPYNNNNGISGLPPGPSSSYFRGSNFQGNGNFSSNNAFNALNTNLFRSDFALGTTEPQVPQNGHFTSSQTNQFLQSEFTGSGLRSDLIGASGPQVTTSVIGAQRNSGLSGTTTLILPSELPQTQTTLTTNLGLLPNPSGSTQPYDYLPNASTGLPTSSSVARANESDSGLLSGLESSRISHLAPVASSRDVFNTAGHRNSSSSILNTTGDRLVAGANREGNSSGNSSSLLISDANTEGNLVQRSGQSGGSAMNRNYGTESVESTDNSLIELEQRVEEACAMVERVLREREEREEFGREIERKEREIRAERARKKREREARELQEASGWPQQQEPITGQSQWLCEHYQRHCRVRFPCCTHFYSCHRCHNNSKACDNEEAKASHATHLKCSYCQHEQEIDEDSAKCRSCGAKMSAYFCAICKHFTSIDKNPYHCEKCGICRIHKDKSFHCEVCNVCLDKRLQGKHKCRPDSGHDECCICLEDAFSGCQILPCSHKVHRECAIAMIQNGIRTCPVCRHPLYSPAPD